MRRSAKTIAGAGLLAGLSTPTFAAQQAASPPVPLAGPPAAPAPAPATATAATTAPPVTEFRGPDGKLLPPELQKKLQEQIKNGALTPRPAGDRDIVVNGRKPRGAALGDIPPERVLSALDIRSYGANSVEDLIQALGQQVTSSRGKDGGGPIVLLNGRRVSSFAEIAKIPTEAIERMEILPEEVALKYGYRADQKVLNVVTFERFTSRIGQLALGAPTDGGRTTTGGTANDLRIRDDTRYIIDADLSRSSALLESERDVRQAGGTSALGQFRTLLPEIRHFGLGGTVAGTPLRNVSATLNAKVDATTSKALIGVGAAGALRRDTHMQTGHLGTTVGGRSGSWSWNVTGNVDRTRSATATDTGVAATPRDASRFLDTVANADVLLSGALFDLPAGAVSTSVRGGFSTRDFSASSRLGGVTRTTDLSRDVGTAQASLDVPLASRNKHALAAIGSLSANVNVAVERTSRFGTLRTLGYGLYWSPVTAITLVASVSDEEEAPTVEQLGAPLSATPNQRTFDYARRETVDVTRVLGGNPALRADDRHILNLGLSAKPFAKTNLELSVDYVRTRIDDPIGSLPFASPQLEAAFPSRFTRDFSGRLQRIDGTPVNFAASEQRQLRWGINFTRPLGPVPASLQNASARVFSSEAEAMRRLPPGAPVTFVEAGSPGARRFENLASRLTFSVQHIWRLQDEVLLRSGTPVLDLLNGGTLDSRGGRPRHEIEVQSGAFKRGLGARITGRWQSATSALGGGAGDLGFSDLATLDVGLFANVADYLGRSKAPDWLKGVRLSLTATNLFNARQDVRDGTGQTPLGYQPAYLNPAGRTIALSVRKIL